MCTVMPIVLLWSKNDGRDEELINKYLNEKGKLDCSDAFKIAAKLKCSPLEVGDMAKAMEI